MTYTLLLLACGGAAPGQGADPAPVIADTAATGETTTLDTGERALQVEIPGVPTERLDPLVCTVNSTDPTITLEWWVDDVLFDGLLLSGDRTDDTVFPGETAAGQVWTCVARAADGEEASDSVEVQPLDLLVADPFVAPTALVQEDLLRYSGELAASEAVTAYIGYDGCSLREKDPASLVTLTTEGNHLYFREVPLTKDGDSWIAPLEIPDTVRTVHMYFSADGLTDDHEEQLYDWDLLFPSAGPFLTWNDVAQPADGVVVSWSTGQPGLGIVEYGPDEDHLAIAVGTEEGTLHHVTIQGLPADTEWVYRVRDARARRSAMSTFRTALPDEDTYTFLVASDMQDTGGNIVIWPEIARVMVEGWPEARFVVAPGDLPANDYPSLWWLFFEGGRELFNHIPLVPAIGNHETPGIKSNPDISSYLRWFDLPTDSGSEAYYRLDYGQSRFFSLNTEIPEELDSGEVQDVWLHAETEALWQQDGSREVQWAFAQFHHPGYDAGRRFAYETEDYRGFSSAFDGNVDLVFQAHEHIYQRFLPLVYDCDVQEEFGLSEGQGVAYVVTPSAGMDDLNEDLEPPDGEYALQRELVAWPEIEANQSSTPVQLGFLVVEVSPERLTVSFMGMGTPEALLTSPVLLDSFTIEH